jgi:hypothetical protein
MKVAMQALSFRPPSSPPLRFSDVNFMSFTRVKFRLELSLDIQNQAL